MSKFKIGDRVVVYWTEHACVHGGPYFQGHKFIAIVKDNKPINKGLILVHFNDGTDTHTPSQTWVHEKQCRKLVKKKKSTKEICIGDTVFFINKNHPDYEELRGELLVTGFNGNCWGVHVIKLNENPNKTYLAHKENLKKIITEEEIEHLINYCAKEIGKFLGEQKPKLEPFNLERALAGERVMTRDGQKIKRIYVRENEPENSYWKVVAFYSDNEWYNYDIAGRYCPSLSDYDLFMAPKEKKEPKFKIDDLVWLPWENVKIGKIARYTLRDSGYHYEIKYQDGTYQYKSEKEIQFAKHKFTVGDEVEVITPSFAWYKEKNIIV